MSRRLIVRGTRQGVKTPGALLHQIAKYYDIDIEQLKAKNRQAPLPDIRHLYCLLAKEMFPRASYREIGGFIDRDHATVMHGISKYLKCYEFEKFCDDYLIDNKQYNNVTKKIWLRKKFLKQQ